MSANIERFMGITGGAASGSVPRTDGTNNPRPNPAEPVSDIINLSEAAMMKMHDEKPPEISAAEMYISHLLSRQLPYGIEMLGNEFIIKDHNTYPPGNLTKMFGKFIVESKVSVDKVVADIGIGSFALGIIAAKNGAKHVIGSGISAAILDLVRGNIEHNKVEDNIISLYQGNFINALLPQFEGKVDVIFAGLPWDSISEAGFEQIPDSRKELSYAFYDIDDQLMRGLISDGFKLLSEDGKIYITSDKSHIERIDKLCIEHNLKYATVKAEDIHKDGNIHFILELVRS